MNQGTPSKELNIVLFGPPGAGKGTQADFIVKHYGLKHLSTGDMLRAEIESKTSLGSKVKTLLDAGELVPDNTMIDLIAKRIEEPDCQNGFILDGFPRTINQAGALDRVLEEKDKELDAVIQIQIDESELLKRLKTRIQEQIEKGEPIRSDDNEHTLKNRVQVYRKQTAPVLPYYEEKSVLKTVDGMQEIDKVSEDIKEILDNL